MGGIRADTQRERQHRNRGETRALAHGSQGVTKILRDSFEHDPSPHFPTHLLQQCDVTEPVLRFVTRRIVINSRTLVFLLAQLFVELHLFVEIALELPSVDEKSQPSPKLGEPITHSAKPPLDRLLWPGVPECRLPSRPSRT